MRGLSLHGIMSGLTLLILSTLLFLLAYDRIEAPDRRPPVIFHRTWIDEAIARPGDVVWVNVDRTRVRYCPGSTLQFWVRGGASDYVQAGIAPAGASQELGRSVGRFLKRVPEIDEESLPDEWCYAPQISYACNDGQHYVSQPPACVLVVPNQSRDKH